MVKKGYKQTEIGVFPEDWEIKPMSDLFEFKNGLNKEKEFFGYGTPIINYMDVFNHYGLFKKHIKGKVSLDSRELTAYSAKKGDVFFTRTSETQQEIGMSSVLLEDIKNCVFSGFVLRGRSLKPFDDTYKKFCFRSEEVRKQIISSSSYTTRALTNGKLLSKIQIPLPPTLIEQKAIATALTDIDNLITNLETLITKKKALKQGAMQQLLTGKKRLKGFTGDWETKKLGEIFDITAGGDLTKEEFSTFKTEKYIYPVFSNSHSNKGLYGYYKTYDYDGNSITISARGGIGFTEFRIGKYKPIGRLLVLFPEKNIDCKFIQEYINLKIEFSVESTGVPQLTAPQVSKYKISFPKIKEQKAIAEILSDMDTEIEVLEQQKSKTQYLKQGMMQELLTGKTRLVKPVSKETPLAMVESKSTYKKDD